MQGVKRRKQLRVNPKWSRISNEGISTSTRERRNFDILFIKNACLSQRELKAIIKVFILVWDGQRENLQIVEIRLNRIV